MSSQSGQKVSLFILTYHFTGFKLDRETLVMKLYALFFLLVHFWNMLMSAGIVALDTNYIKYKRISKSSYRCPKTFENLQAVQRQVAALTKRQKNNEVTNLPCSIT